MGEEGVEVEEPAATATGGGGQHQERGLNGEMAGVRGEVGEQGFAGGPETKVGGGALPGSGDELEDLRRELGLWARCQASR